MALAESVTPKGDTIENIYYFTTFAKWKKPSWDRHKLYVKALRSVKVKDIHGRFMRHKETCNSCGHEFWAREEKQTDVNIACVILCDAMNDLFDKAIIVSGDTDLIPVINAVHSHFPNKEIGVMFPLRRYRSSLEKVADFAITMKEQLLKQSQFDDEIEVGGTILSRPDYWK